MISPLAQIEKSQNRIFVYNSWISLIDELRWLVEQTIGHSIMAYLNFIG